MAGAENARKGELDWRLFKLSLSAEKILYNPPLNFLVKSEYDWWLALQSLLPLL